MNGWYLMYLLATMINVGLMRIYTDLTLADAVFWLWMFVPILSYVAGREFGD